MKIGVYQHSSVARDLLVDVLAHYGAEITALGRSESFIPVDTEAVSDETVTLMKRWVSEHKFDAIVSTDGDGDRPLVADETGTPLRGDLLGLVAANFLDAGTVVTPVTSNSGIEAAGSFAVRRTRVGSPFVISGMPGWLQPVTLINPLRYFLVIVKGVFLKDIPLSEVVNQTIPLALIATVTLSAAAWLFRRRLE